jgi:predicted nucleic acid-binding protein
VAIYFIDSSALVKRYVIEAGSRWVQSVTDPRAGHSIYMAQITCVEVVAAINKRARMNEVSRSDATAAIADFKFDLNTQYNPLEITDQIVTRAMALTELYPLRAYDAMQLAAAIEVHALGVSLGVQALGVPAAVMVSADKTLNLAALSEGLSIENPNSYP